MRVRARLFGFCKFNALVKVHQNVFYIPGTGIYIYLVYIILYLV